MSGDRETGETVCYTKTSRERAMTQQIILSGYEIGKAVSEYVSRYRADFPSGKAKVTLRASEKEDGGVEFVAVVEPVAE